MDFVGARDDRDFSTYPAERIELPSYLVLGVSFEVPLRASGGIMPLDLTVRGDNLLNEAYEEVLGYRAAGRTVSVGVRMRFGGEG